MGVDPLGQLEMEREDADIKASQKMKKIPVMEIFGPTIQGEGAMCGVRTSFIRFGLCDYRCTMCDSLHAVLPDLVRANARRLTPEQIATELFQVHGILKPHTAADYLGMQNASWVTFSGGNPCIHDLSELIYRIRGLDELGHVIKIAVETQGTLLPEWLHMCDVITVSPKSPGMGEQFEEAKFMRFLLMFKHHAGLNVKVVIFSQQDLEFAQHINSLMCEEGLGDKMYISLGNPFPPGKTKIEGEDGHVTDDDIKIRLLNDYRILAEDLLQMPHMQNVRFLPQLHVLAWANKQMV